MAESLIEELHFPVGKAVLVALFKKMRVQEAGGRSGTAEPSGICSLSQEPGEN